MLTPEDIAALKRRINSPNAKRDDIVAAARRLLDAHAELLGGAPRARAQVPRRFFNPDGTSLVEGEAAHAPADALADFVAAWIRHCGDDPPPVLFEAIEALRARALQDQPAMPIEARVHRAERAVRDYVADTGRPVDPIAAAALVLRAYFEESR